jgi:ribosomal protein S18 acetylase RimI-like enzyme
MAAQPSPALDIIDLRRVRSLDLAPLLAEETRHWRMARNWDFTRSAELVRRFTELHALNGAALISETGTIAGYCYQVIEDAKGLIGNLFLTESYRTQENENRLLEPVLKQLLTAPIRRVESQLMMFDAQPEFLRRLRSLPGGKQARVFDRDFMLVHLDGMALADERVGREVIFTPWSAVLQDSAAQMIADAYSGHIDSQINDQYRSVYGARKFLYNIVQYPGCGTFQLGSSLAAVDAESGELSGICLTSLVGEESGHITQLCVTPRMQGRGVGRALLRRSLRLMRDQNCRTASLTVTSANQEALRLYLRAGFRSVRHFPACVWEGGQALSPVH